MSYETLVKHEQLVDLILNHGYIPQKDQQNFNEVIAALRNLDPQGKYDPGCSGCMTEIAMAAKKRIKLFKE